MNFYGWAARWGISPMAIAELFNELNRDGTPGVEARGTSEAGNVAMIRMEAANKQILMFRNNVGALKDADGRFVRYGLANDSIAINRRIKSGDLIGIRPIKVGAEHIGHTIGQFVSREVKHGSWHYSGDEHEQAQQRWAMLVNTAGGDAQFATGVGTL